MCAPCCWAAVTVVALSIWGVKSITLTIPKPVQSKKNKHRLKETSMCSFHVGMSSVPFSPSSSGCPGNPRIIFQQKWYHVQQRCRSENRTANRHRQKKERASLYQTESAGDQSDDPGCCSHQHISAVYENTKSPSLNDHSQLRVCVWFRCVKAISYRPVKPQYPLWNLTHT